MDQIVGRLCGCYLNVIIVCKNKISFSDSLISITSTIVWRGRKYLCDFQVIRWTYIWTAKAVKRQVDVLLPRSIFQLLTITEKMSSSRFLSTFLFVSVIFAIGSQAAVFSRISQKASCPVVTTKPDFNYIPVYLNWIQNIVNSIFHWA